MTKHLYKTALATAISMVALLISTATVYADGVAPTVTPTRTPTATPTLAPETRVECTTGAYGQQTCKTIIVERVASPSGVPAHKVVNSGLAENVIFALFAVFIISSVSYGYARVRA